MTVTKIEQYEIREPVVGDIPDFFDLLQKPTSLITEALIRNVVYLDGEKVGDRIKDIPVRLVIKITNAVVEAAGLTSGNA